MEYNIEDIEATFNAEIVQKLGNSEYLVKINENERNLKILNMSAKSLEFILDQKYHHLLLLQNSYRQFHLDFDACLK